MQNFEMFKDAQFTGAHAMSEHPHAISPPTTSSPSLLMTSPSGSTCSPQAQNLKQYTLHDMHPKGMIQSSMGQTAPPTSSHTMKAQQYLTVNEGLSCGLNQPTQILGSTAFNQVASQNDFGASQQPQTQIICNDEIQLLKQHLKQKYKNYSEQEIEEIIYKFVNEYLNKMKNGGASSSCSQNTDFGESVSEDGSRSSLSSNLDWNSRQDLEKYCRKQKRIEEEMGFRPSEYFGAISVDHLEDGIDNPKIDELFSEVFGIRPKPKKRVEQIQRSKVAANLKGSFVQSDDTVPNTFNLQPVPMVSEPTSQPQQQLNPCFYGSQNQPLVDNKQYIENDPQKMCVIQQDIYYIYMNNGQQPALPQQHHQQMIQQPFSAQQEAVPTQVGVLGDKQNSLNKQANRLLPDSSSSCQVLHQDQKSSTSAPLAYQKAGPQPSLTPSQQLNNLQASQENLKKYMSPSEIQKMKHTKNISKSIAESENQLDTQGLSYKTAELLTQNSQSVSSNAGSQALKQAQTQLNSPQSMNTSSTHFSKHLQQLSSLIGPGSSNPVAMKDTQPQFSHHNSLSNLNYNSKGLGSSGSSTAKHQSTSSLSKQSFKGILYKQQSAQVPPHHQNMLSISSTTSIDNKPKQQSKLSYINQKQLLSDQQPTHNYNTCSDATGVRLAPKPPHQGFQLNAKNQRDSQVKDGIDTFSNDSAGQECGCSPKVSPQRTIFQLHSDSTATNSTSAGVVKQFKVQNGKPSLISQNSSTSNLLTSSIDQFPPNLNSTSSLRTFREQPHQHHAHGAFSSGQNTQRSGTSSKTATGAASSKAMGRNNSQNFFKTQNMLNNNVQSFLMVSEDSSKVPVTGSGQFKDSEGQPCSPLGYSSKNLEMINPASKPTHYTGVNRPQTTISGNFSTYTGINQYISGASQLGPSSTKAANSKHVSNKLGFLTHNSSAKNLKFQQNKNLSINTLNPTTSSIMCQQNSSRKMKHELDHTSECPKSSRGGYNNQQHQQRFGSKPTSLSKERYIPQKSVERTKKLQPHEIDSSAAESLEKKRMLYKNQKQVTSSKNQSMCGINSQKHASGANSTSTLTCGSKNPVTRNHQTSAGAPTKVNSANLINEYLKNQGKTTLSDATNGPLRTSAFENQKPDSHAQTMQRINKSLDKIKQIFMSGNQQNGASTSASNGMALVPKSPQVPHSTKHSNTNEFKSNELIQQINSYKTYMKKSKINPNESNASVSSSATLNVKAKAYTMHQKPSKDGTICGTTVNSSIDTTLNGASATVLAKKSQDSFKRYLSGTMNASGLHQFK